MEFVVRKGNDDESPAVLVDDRKMKKKSGFWLKLLNKPTSAAKRSMMMHSKTMTEARTTTLRF
ncbi:hypothetical protein BVC80_9061g21 [Macleaya cordata]|uniref:Uncharacterized protein n=1 Tax=Macleaya cordata TaxID=56857 RepID=A0A200PN30_MACCD|nr:hypothetical protein BVC80_9061g21 [Macleaya cordata]